MNTLTPRRVVEELDRYIIGQAAAKRAVAVALRNRHRRQMVSKEIRDEISPKNILLIGRTGVGKTEIARRVANLAEAPFIKVEATKYTEVGYVGRDVESMIRDLVEVAVNQVKRQESDLCMDRATEKTEEVLLDSLLPGSGKPKREGIERFIVDLMGRASPERPPGIEGPEESNPTRDKLKALLREGRLDDREVEIDLKEQSVPLGNIFHGAGLEDLEIQLRGMMKGMVPDKTKRRRMTVKEARPLVLKDQIESLLDMDKVVRLGVERAEGSGIIFVDEIDKIAVAETRRGGAGPDVSREGVQRDLLPIIEGTTAMTKYGAIRTDRILFIGAGAFNLAKPSDLIPELQGRFPIRVELEDLTQADLRRILVEPQNAIVRQYEALLAADGVTLEFTDGALDQIAALAWQVNVRAENIGARRLHTVVERLLEEILFQAPDPSLTHVTLDEATVNQRLSGLVEDKDLSKFIL